MPLGLESPCFKTLSYLHVVYDRLFIYMFKFGEVLPAFFDFVFTETYDLTWAIRRTLGWKEEPVVIVSLHCRFKTPGSSSV